MFDPQDFARWLRRRYPQYNPLPDRDQSFIESVSRGDMEHMAAYDSNRKFFMKQIAEYMQDQQLRNKFLCLFLAVGLALFFSGVFALLYLGAK